VDSLELLVVAEGETGATDEEGTTGADERTTGTEEGTTGTTEVGTNATEVVEVVHSEVVAVASTVVVIYYKESKVSICMNRSMWQHCLEISSSRDVS
jgi:hypothetical protein